MTPHKRQRDLNEEDLNTEASTERSPPEPETRSPNALSLGKCHLESGEVRGGHPMQTGEVGKEQWQVHGVEILRFRFRVSG